MPEEKKDKNGQIGEEDLDALLARWAEAEIEPTSSGYCSVTSQSVEFKQAQNTFVLCTNFPVPFLI